MPTLDSHVPGLRVLIVGDPGCLAGSTQVRISRGTHKGRIYPLEVVAKQLLKKPIKYAHGWDLTIPTEILSWDGEAVARQQILEAYDCGLRAVRRISTEFGAIDATREHKFLTPEGWMDCADLKLGTPVLVRPNERRSVQQRKTKGPTGRVTIYAIPHHPYAFDNWVNGKNYKRNARARLVVEADINSMTLEEFVWILRNNAEHAGSLDYLRSGLCVHHIDNDPSNDDLRNLEVMSNEMHNMLHREARPELRFGNISADFCPVDSISDCFDTETYDLLVPDTNNYVANGFVVHNSGKTTAIGKLAEAGQELFICDFDNNLNPVSHFVKPEALKRVHFETLVDPVQFDANGKPVVPGIPPAFSSFIKLSNEWRDSTTGENYGDPDKWERGRWFVVDSLTTLGNAAMNYTMHKRRRWGKRRGFAEWGDAIERVEGCLQMFAGSPTHLICTAHLARLNMEDVTADADDDGKPIDAPTAAKRLPPNAAMRYPVALGQKLPPRIGGYFNLVVQAQRIGSGVNARRVLRTVPEEDVDIKVPLPPRTVPPEVPIDQLWSILKPFVQGD